MYELISRLWKLSAILFAFEFFVVLATGGEIGNSTTFDIVFVATVAVLFIAPIILSAILIRRLWLPRHRSSSTE